MSPSTHTIQLHRVLRAPAERIYRAFLDPDALRKFLSPHGFTCQVHELDARVGGRYRMSFTNFSNGQRHGFGGEYLELVPGERIVKSDRFGAPVKRVPTRVRVPPVQLDGSAPKTVPTASL
jgi:uncharacterized protein YndB with AHSA1/START domain